MSENGGDSWEVRAFEEDKAGNLMGCTWPPRSYTCTFCRREFRSAQALGGHMNVHRQDRVRLLHHEAPPSMAMAGIKAPSPSRLITTGREFLANGLCLLYPLPNHNTTLIPTAPMHFLSPSHGISVLAAAGCTDVSSMRYSANHKPSPSNSNGNDDSTKQELDLELRLGQSSTPSP